MTRGELLDEKIAARAAEHRQSIATCLHRLGNAWWGRWCFDLEIPGMLIRLGHLRRKCRPDGRRSNILQKDWQADRCRDLLEIGEGFGSGGRRR